jgi:predicted nuclease of predicted toxin-antitoxin system
MKIKLDHNLSRHLRGTLESFGHDVDTAFEEGLARASDREVLLAATAQDRILFTLTQISSTLRNIRLNDKPALSCLGQRGKVQWP